MKPLKPECLALIICERVEPNPATDRINLLGIFGKTSMRVQEMAAYVALTSARGAYELEFVMEREATGETQPLGRIRVDCESELRWFETSISNKEVAFRAPGIHWVKVYMNGEFIAQRKFDVEPP